MGGKNSKLSKIPKNEFNSLKRSAIMTTVQNAQSVNVFVTC